MKKNIDEIYFNNEYCNFGLSREPREYIMNNNEEYKYDERYNGIL